MKTSALTISLILLTSLFSSCNKDDDGRPRRGYSNLIDVSSKPWINQDLRYGRVLDIDGNEYATITVGNHSSVDTSSSLPNHTTAKFL
jgi:hypothetical protein